VTELTERLRREIVRTVKLDILHQEAADHIEAQAERIRVLREALEVATNWLSDDRHPIGWTVDRLRAALEATK